jgi:hypothetical protein
MRDTDLQTGDVSVDFTLISTLGNSTLLYAAAGFLSLVLAFWVTYRVVKAAVRDGIKEAGLYSNRAMAQGGRKQLDPKYDFVYTEPRPE